MAYTTKNRITKIDTETAVYKKAYDAGGTSGIEAVVKQSVSYTEQAKAKAIYDRLISEMEFPSSTYDEWCASVREFIDTLSIAIRDGYGTIEGTGETAALSGLYDMILRTLSPMFKESIPKSRKSDYEDTTIRDVVSYYDPSGTSQQQADTMLASELAVGMSSTQSATVRASFDGTALSSRADAVGVPKRVETSPDAFVCIADEVYDKDGNVDEEASDAVADAKSSYESSMGQLYEKYNASYDGEQTQAPYVTNIINATFPFTAQDISNEEMISAGNGKYVMTSDIVPASEVSDNKAVKQYMDDMLCHDDTVSMDTINADSHEGTWIPNQENYVQNQEELLDDQSLEWKVKDAVTLHYDGVAGESSDQVSVTRNASWYEYGMKIVELAPVGVDRASFGEEREFIVKSVIQQVGSLSSNAEIQNPVPPGGQNAIGFYYNKHNARALNFSFELHQQEYPDKPLSAIATQLQELTRPYQYQDSHLETKRCRIHLPGMTFEGYVNNVSTSLSGDLYTSWNDGLPESAENYQNTTQDQYSYGKLSVSLSFLIDEQISLRQVQSDQKFDLKYDPTEDGDGTSVSLDQAIEDVVSGLPVPLDPTTAKRLFENISAFTLHDFINVRNWFHDIFLMMQTMDVSEDKKSKYLEWETKTDGYVTLATIAWEAYDAIRASEQLERLTLLKDPTSKIANKYSYNHIINGKASRWDELQIFNENYVDTHDDSTFSSDNVMNALKVIGIISGAVITTVAVTVATAGTGTAAAIAFDVALATGFTMAQAGVIVALSVTIITLIFDLDVQLITEVVHMYQGDSDGKRTCGTLTDKDISAVLSQFASGKVHPMLRKLFDGVKKHLSETTISDKAYEHFRTAMASQKFTIPPGVPVQGENDDGESVGLHPLVFQDEPVMINLVFQTAAMFCRGLARQVLVLSNMNADVDLDELRLKTNTQLAKAAQKGIDESTSATDEVSEIAQKSSISLAAMIQHYRNVEARRLALMGDMVYEASDLSDELELNNLRSDLSAWRTYINTEAFKFKCGYINAIYNSENPDDLWGNEVSSGNAKGGSKYFEMKTFLEYDAETKTWGSIKDTVEIDYPKSWNITDGTAYVPFRFWLESSVYDLCSNGSVSYVNGNLQSSGSKPEEYRADKNDTEYHLPWKGKSNVRQSILGSDMGVTDEDHAKDVFTLAVLLNIGTNESSAYGSNLYAIWNTSKKQGERCFSREYTQSLIDRADKLINYMTYGGASGQQLERLCSELDLMLYAAHITVKDDNGNTKALSMQELYNEFTNYPYFLIYALETAGMPCTGYKESVQKGHVGVEMSDSIRDMTDWQCTDPKICGMPFSEIKEELSRMSNGNSQSVVPDWYLGQDDETMITLGGVRYSFQSIVETFRSGLSDPMMFRIIGWFYTKDGKKTDVAKKFDQLNLVYPSLT